MITWPLLAPTTLVIMVITTIGSFKVFDHIYLMTGGGPENGTLVLAFYIYQQAFKFFNVGYASALAMIMFVDRAGADHRPARSDAAGSHVTCVGTRRQIVYRVCWTISLADRRHPVRLPVPLDGFGGLQERRRDLRPARA